MGLSFELYKLVLKYSETFYISKIYHQTFDVMHCDIKAFL